MINFLRRRLCVAALSAAAAGAMTFGLAAPAAAQDDWPDRPIKLIVGCSAGGTTDVVARILEEGRRQNYGQPINVEDRPGAGSNIEADMDKCARPDGYDMYMGHENGSINHN